MVPKSKHASDPLQRLPPARGPLPALAVFLAIIVTAVGVARLAGRNPDNDPIAQDSPGTDWAVIDGDTVRSTGVTYRLVGFDAPERGDRALCDKERELAETAAARLRDLVASGEPNLQRVACPCKAGTEGTNSCNAGRFCAYLSVAGKDVGEILMREGLARPLVCGPTSCPPRQPWC